MHFAGSQELINLIRREAWRVVAMKSEPRYATVTAYDPDNHLVKAQIQPEGHETAWMPIITDHIGNGFGVLMGPKIGDQIEVSFQEGDPSSPRMIGRVFSDKEKPPRVESGEILVKHELGGFLFFDKDGHLTIQDKAGSKIVFDGSGKVTITATTLVTDADTHLGGEGGQQLHRQGDLDSDGDVAVGHASRVWAV
jgi:phage baseplate assembly protein gpV